MTVYGGNLDSVAEPRITLTVVITRFYRDINTTLSRAEVTCEFIFCCETKIIFILTYFSI